MTDGRMDGGDCNIPDAFLKKRGDNEVFSGEQEKESIICVRMG